MIRKFYLENSKGQVFNFNYYSGCLLANITGLGFSYNVIYLKYDHIYNTVKKDEPLGEISFDIIFLDGYLGYQKLIDYLNIETSNLKLYYTSNDTKYIYVDFVNLSKSEIIDGHLKSGAILNKKTYWIKEKSFILSFDSSVESGKVYPFNYPFSYSETTGGKSRLKIDGVTKASTLIEITGNVKNPSLNVLKGEDIITSMKLNIIKNNAKIVISSIPNEQYIRSYDGLVENDIYHLQDFEKDNFILLEPSDLTLEFNSGTNNETIFKIFIYEYHLG
ncbi:MAG TPA: hypothetical protein PLE44_01270 [Bacilli bacterium]|nr:hypothetical protein [Bacilli bacterium]